MWIDLLFWLDSRINLRDEEGQTAVEYAMVIVGVSLVIVTLLATGIANDLFTAFWTKVKGALD